MGSPGKVPLRSLCKDLKEIRGKMLEQNALWVEGTAGAKALSSNEPGVCVQEGGGRAAGCGFR